jgi:16S rRNA G966 N2-methylase RsmD
VARPATFDLAKELAKPSFTPARGDAAALVELIAIGDEPTATRAAPALAGLGEIGRAAIDARMSGEEATAQSHDPTARSHDPTARSHASMARSHGARTRTNHDAPARSDDGARARLVGVLGLLARAGDSVARAQLIARTGDPAPRVRKAAVVALGKLGGDDARRALIARWDATDAAPEERRALAEALGKVGGDDAMARLQALAASDDAELMRRRDRAVLMADRTARRDIASLVVSDVAPPAPIMIQLGCRPGLGALLCEELAALGIAAAPLGDRGAELRLARPLASLFAARLWATAAIPIPLAPGDDLAAAIIRTITAPATLDLLRAWTCGPIRWRLGFSRGHKRAIVWRVARDVTAAAPELINDPTSTTWDFLVTERGEASAGGAPAGQAPRGASEPHTLAMIPRRLDDPRFAYRVTDIPAASHPTVAAALTWLGGAGPRDRVWDPFCGSGVELIERARRGAVRSLLGTDLDGEVLQAARTNLEAAGVAAELVVADARSHAPGPIDLILTNPPLGSRVQLDAVALLVAALPGFARALNPQGRLVWITPSPRKTSPVAEQLGLVRTRAYPVDLGGVRGQLERWDRR